MCIGGLIFHCFNPSPPFRILDIVATSISATSIPLAFLSHVGILDDQLWRIRLSFVSLQVVIVSFGIFGKGILVEQLYLFPTAAAAVFVFTLGLLSLVKSTKTKSQLIVKISLIQKELLIILTISLLAVGTAPAESLICGLVGSQFLAIVWFFTACNISFLCFQFIASTLFAIEDTKAKLH